jgi:hypothetical protein
MQTIQNINDVDPERLAETAVQLVDLLQARLVKKNLQRHNSTAARRGLTSQGPAELDAEAVQKQRDLHPKRDTTPTARTPATERAPITVADLTVFLVKKCFIKKASDAFGWTLSKIREVGLSKIKQHGSTPLNGLTDLLNDLAANVFGPQPDPQ